MKRNELNYKLACGIHWMDLVDFLSLCMYAPLVYFVPMSPEVFDGKENETARRRRRLLLLLRGLRYVVVIYAKRAYLHYVIDVEFRVRPRMFILPWRSCPIRCANAFVCGRM